MKSRTKARRATSADEDVGRRLRTRRLEMGKSQTELANAIGVTFQQIQKYEKGRNRIGAGRLARICEALEVPASYFIEFDGEDAPNAATHSAVFALAQDRGAIRILEAYRKLPRAKRATLVDTAEALAQ